MIIFIIGFMGSGKSSTGKKLAEKLGYEFVDTDKRIVEKLGMSVNEIFDRLGEETFRKEESRLLKELVSGKNLVVSTGGGLPCHGDNMEIINRNGISVYLKASPEELYARLLSRKHKRPLIRDLSDSELKTFIEEKLAVREPYYKMARHVMKGIDVRFEDLLRRVGD